MAEKGGGDKTAARITTLEFTTYPLNNNTRPFKRVVTVFDRTDMHAGLMLFGDVFLSSLSNTGRRLFQRQRQLFELDPT